RQRQNGHKNCCSFHRYPSEVPNPNPLAVGQQCPQPFEAIWWNSTLLSCYKALQNPELIRRETHSPPPSSTPSSFLRCIVHTCQKSLAMFWSPYLKQEARRLD